MSKRERFRSFGIFLGVLFSVGLVTAQAQVYSGRATGINGILTANGTSTTSIYGDTCPLADTGGTIVSTTPGSVVPSFFRTGLLMSSTSGAGNSSQSSSTVNNLSLNASGYTITATTLTADTQCNCCPGAGQGSCGGDSRITGLVITDPNGANVPVTVTGQANQTITLPNGAGTIIFDEQIVGNASITVNALHVNITNGGRNSNVIVASAHSDINCLVLSPTPADVSISGRVVTAGGQGISRATVTITDGTGNTRSVLSSSAGYYSFQGVTVGQAYVMNATHRSYSFNSKVINLTEEMTGVDFTANP